MTTLSDPALRPLLDDLKARQIAFFQARLVSPHAEDEWRTNIGAVYADLLTTKVASLVDAGALTAAIDAALSDDAIRTAARPLLARVIPALLTEVRESRARAGDHVPGAARATIDALLEQPDIFPERLLREVVEQDAFEEVMRDVLYNTLKEFNDKVNPFFAEWGLPALAKKILPFGLGKGVESLRGEFDKRLEPEIRKFLQGFSRRGLRNMADTMIAKKNEPKSVALRKHIVGWLLAQEVADMVRPLDEKGVRLANELGVDIAAHVLSMEVLKERRRALIEEIVTANKDRTVAEALADHGVTLTLDLDAIARATWPLVRSALSTPAATAWIASLISEFFEEAAAKPA